MPAAETDRRPHNIQLEQALLGALLTNNAVHDRIGHLIRPGYFSEPIHQKIYEIAETEIQAGKIANPVTLKHLLPVVDVHGLTMAEYVARLAAEATTVVGAPDYADTMKGLAGLRAGINLGDWLAQASTAGVSAKELLLEFYRRADEMRLEFMSDHRHADTVSASEAAARVVEEITLVRQGKVVPGKISTGLHEVDTAMGGLYRGDLIIAGGRPGQGKTTLGLHLGKACAAAGKGAGMFSLEMPEKHITARLLADMCASGHANDMPYQRIIDPKMMTDAEHQKIVDAQRDLENIPFAIDATSKLTLGALSAKIRGMRNRIRARWGVDLWLVIVDYIKFLQASDRYFGDRVREVGEISGGLKQIAKDENICIVALNQLSRKVEERANKRPELSDLRECVVGSTRMVDASTGHWVPISKVKPGAFVLGVDKDQKIGAFQVADRWSTGVRDTYRLTTRTGKQIVATDNHPFLTATGWLALGQLSQGSVIATAMRLPDRQWAESDLLWEEIRSIEPAGKQRVYDVSIPGCHNFIADGIVAHNSGDLEQDADVVFFVYRDAYYLGHHPDLANRQDIQSQLVQAQNDMEIDCAKNRMGPTGRSVVWCSMGTSSIRSNLRRQAEPTLMTEAEMQEGFR